MKSKQNTISVKFGDCLCIVNERRKKGQLDATQWFIELVVCSTCFGHHYAHHQEPETIRVVTVCGTWHCKGETLVLVGCSIVRVVLLYVGWSNVCMVYLVCRMPHTNLHTIHMTYQIHHTHHIRSPYTR